MSKTLYSSNFAITAPQNVVNCKVLLNQTTIIHFFVGTVVVLQTQYDAVVLYDLS